MRLKLRTVILLAITVAVFVWKIMWSETPAPPPESINVTPLAPRSAHPSRQTAPETPAPPATPGKANSQTGATPAAQPSTQPGKPAAQATSPAVAPEPVSVADSLENLGLSLRDFRSALGGNPVGTNAEITAALLGDNARQMKLPLPAGSTLNDRGELCDPWGSAWFFHQLSGTVMEIRSAGPDRILHTADDIVR